MRERRILGIAGKGSPRLHAKQACLEIERMISIWAKPASKRMMHSSKRCAQCHGREFCLSGPYPKLVVVALLAQYRDPGFYDYACHPATDIVSFLEVIRALYGRRCFWRFLFLMADWSYGNWGLFGPLMLTLMLDVLGLS